jgi:5-methylcytosine-specific restriction protein B
VDAALERRLAKIAMDPDAGLLERMLIDNGVEDGLRGRIIQFFTFLQRNPNPYTKVGHAYFRRVRDEASLRRLWNHQLRFHQEKAYRLLGDDSNPAQREWDRLFGRAPERPVPVVELTPDNQSAAGGPPDANGQTEGQEEQT